MSYASKPDSYFEGGRPEMLRFVPPTARRTLELGCGSGGFSAALKDDFPRECWGVELDSRAAQKAMHRLDRVIIGEATAVAPDLPAGYFDCIILNDMLEHVADPFSLLRGIRSKLHPVGVIVASVPNVRFWNSLRDLVWRGDWDYKEAGILDSTHLRFFTFKSLQKMFPALGYDVLHIEGLKPTRNKKYRILNFLLFNRLWDVRYHQFACVVRPSVGRGPASSCRTWDESMHYRRHLFADFCRWIQRIVGTGKTMKFPGYHAHRGGNEPLKLHVGCGNVRFDGWVNIDVNGKHLDVKRDVRKGLPFADDSASLIYNEHFLEHLTCEEGLAVLREFYRVLRPGGVARIATPDLDYLVAKYTSDDWRAQYWLQNLRTEIQTRAEMLNVCFHDWGHKYLYNAEELERRLREVGFGRISRQPWHVSPHPELANRETREDSKLILEAAK